MLCSTCRNGFYCGECDLEQYDAFHAYIVVRAGEDYIIKDNGGRLIAAVTEEEWEKFISLNRI